MTIEDYIIREAEKPEAASIFSLLQDHHFPDAVIIQGFLAKNRDRITEADENLIAEKWKRFVFASPSLVLVHKDTNEIVGVVLFVPTDNSKPCSSVEQLPEDEEPKILDELDAIFKRLDVEDNMRQRFPEAKKTMKLRLMTVHKSHRGKGLAKVLLRESVEWARTRGFDLVHGCFTLLAAKKVALGAGFVKLAEFDLHTVKNDGGSSILPDISPHNITWIMTMTIDT